MVFADHHSARSGDHVDDGLFIVLPPDVHHEVHEVLIEATILDGGSEGDRAAEAGGMGKE